MQARMDLDERAAAAESLIREHVRETPLERSPALSALAGCDVSLKLENFQETGSFKLRGVFAMLLSAPRGQIERGVVTASTGNHGLATAHAASILGIQVDIVVPEGTARFRLEALRRAGVEPSVRGSECSESESLARAEAESTGRLYVPPYNDLDVIAGQGTIAMELARQCDSVDVVAATVGGGGLISGVAGAMKEAGLKPVVLGCVPRNSPAMYESVRAGRVVNVPVAATLSDSSAGNIERGSITLEYCRDYVDEWAVVTESEIIDAVRVAYREHDMVVEGAAGVAVAGLLQRIGALGLNRGSHAVVIICGGNVSPEQFADIVMDDAYRARLGCERGERG